MKNSAKTSGLIICLFFMVSAQAFAGKGPVANKSDNITYIDIGIYQPNVEDCYVVNVPDTGMEPDWIKIYPNPSSGFFTLELNLQQPAKDLIIRIYDISGKLVFQTRETSDGNYLNKDINISDFRKGVYFIRITGENKVAVKQIIIN